MGRGTRITLVLLIGILTQPLFCQTSVAQAQVQYATAAPRAPALDSALSPGHKFDQANALRLLGVDSTLMTKAAWAQIPSWLAGTWESKGYEITQNTNERTGVTNTTRRYMESLGNRKFGQAQDFEDKIWWGRIVGTAISEGPNVVVLTYFYEPTSITSYAVITRLKFVRFTLTGSSSAKKIKNVVQVDVYSHYLPTANGLYAQCRVHGYDWQGNPIDSSTQEETYYLTQPFKPDERYANSFRLYQERSAEAIQP
jgi:hypothetical protein